MARDRLLPQWAVGTAWRRFGLWLVVGLALYFAYGFKHSRLRQTAPL
jgi:hypothetical protein